MDKLQPIYITYSEWDKFDIQKSSKNHIQTCILSMGDLMSRMHHKN